MDKQSITRIELTRQVRDALKARKRGGETYDATLRRILRVPDPEPRQSDVDKYV